MTEHSLTLEQSTEAEMAVIESVLEANGLPADDLRANPADVFLAHADGECIATGGIEAYGSAGLLRSVVVTEPNRGNGHGTALCDELEAYARRQGIERLYLLTTTAAEFFRRRGYEPVPRNDAPQPIRETTEFSTLCPDSATCMRKRL